MNNILKSLQKLILTNDEEQVKDCTTCDWGKFNDYHNLYFCYNGEECIECSAWKEKQK